MYATQKHVHDDPLIQDEINNIYEVLRNLGAENFNDLTAILVGDDGEELQTHKHSSHTQLATLPQLEPYIHAFGLVTSATKDTITLEHKVSSIIDTWNQLTGQTVMLLTLVGELIEIESGTGSGQKRIITSALADGSNRTLTVGRNWDTQPDATSRVHIHLHPPNDHPQYPHENGFNILYGSNTHEGHDIFKALVLPNGTTAPSPRYVGDVWYNSSKKKQYISPDGSTWKSAIMDSIGTKLDGVGLIDVPTVSSVAKITNKSTTENISIKTSVLYTDESTDPSTPGTSIDSALGIDAGQSVNAYQQLNAAVATTFDDSIFAGLPIAINGQVMTVEVNAKVSASKVVGSNNSLILNIGGNDAAIANATYIELTRTNAGAPPYDYTVGLYDDNAKTTLLAQGTVQVTSAAAELDIRLDTVASSVKGWCRISWKSTDASATTVGYDLTWDTSNLPDICGAINLYVAATFAGETYEMKVAT